MAAKKPSATKPAKPAASAKKPAPKKPLTRTAPKAVKPDAEAGARGATAKPSTPTSAATKGRGGDLANVLSSAPYPTDAAGLARAKGLGVSSGVEAFLGLGFPHMIVPTDEPLGTFADRASFLKAHAPDANVMPRAAVRLQLAVQTDYAASPTLPKPKALALEKAVADAIRYHTGRTAWQLEVLFGTLPVAEAIVARLAATPEKAWDKLRGAAPIVRALPWILWRIPAADRVRLLSQLEVVFEGLPSYPGVKALDLLLHGRTGVERSGRTLTGALHLGTLTFATDDPDWARDEALRILSNLRPQDREHFDPQLVVLCPDLLPVFRASLPKFMVEQRPRMEAHLSLFV
jgi:hypothetical protein